MSANRFALQLALAAAMALMAQAASAVAAPSFDRSAIAQYQRPSSLYLAKLADGMESTAFLIDSGNDAAPALLVATGHGVHRVIDGVGEQLVGKGIVTFEEGGAHVFPVAQIRYTSLRGLDFSILELQQTQGALKALGIVPMKLAGRKAAEGDPLTIAARLSGNSQSVARWGTQELTRIDLRTGRGFLNRHLLVMDGARLQEGDSGSPVLDSATGSVLAVTHSANARKGYSSDLSFLSACLQNGRFEANASDCGLSNAFNVSLDEDDDRLIYKAGNGSMMISQTLYSTTTLYQTKLVEFPEQCEESDGYGVAQASGSALNVPIKGLNLAPANPTVLALCVWGRDATGPEPANRNAVALPVVVHPVGPAGRPELDIGKPYKDKLGRNAYLVSAEPEQIALRRVELKSGPWAGTDCADPSGYVALAGARKVLVTEDTRLCAVGVDYAGQRSRPVKRRLLP